MPINPMASRWCNLYRGTPAEHALEPAIAALGVPYRTQFPLFLFSRLRYFPDFVLLNQRVIIEVDDPSHNRAAKREEDARRTQELKAAGWKVARCTNEDALQHPFATVQRLMRELGLEHLSAPTVAPSPAPGQFPSPTVPYAGAVPEGIPAAEAVTPVQRPGRRRLAE